MLIHVSCGTTLIDFSCVYITKQSQTILVSSFLWKHAVHIRLYMHVCVWSHTHFLCVFFSLVGLCWRTPTLHPSGRARALYSNSTIAIHATRIFSDLMTLMMLIAQSQEWSSLTRVWNSAMALPSLESNMESRLLPNLGTCIYCTCANAHSLFYYLLSSCVFTVHLACNIFTKLTLIYIYMYTLTLLLNRDMLVNAQSRKSMMYVGVHVLHVSCMATVEPRPGMYTTAFASRESCI